MLPNLEESGLARTREGCPNGYDGRSTATAKRQVASAFWIPGITQR